MANFSDSGCERMSLGKDWDFTETEYELSTLPSDSRRSSAVESILSSRLSSNLSLRSDDSQTSYDSSQAVTLVSRSHSLLSCNFSDVSVRTGSTAYQRLPIRPAPPIPPPGRPRRNTLTPERNPPAEEAVGPLVTQASATPPSPSASHSRAALSRSHSKLGRSISLKRPRLKRIVSSANSMKFQPSSLPANPLSRTFSSEGVRHLLKSLPPAYPPPPPPDSHSEVSQKPPPYSVTAPHRSRSLDLPSPPLAAPPLPISPRPTTTTSYRSHNTSFSECLISRSEETPTSTDRSSSSHDLRRRGWVCISSISVLLSCICCVFSVIVYWHKNPWQVCTLKKGHSLNTSDFCVVECLDSTRLCQENNTNSETSFVSFHGFFHTDSGTCETKNHTLKLDNLSDSTTILQHQQGVSSEDGKLRILQSGLYFVYSSISFRNCNKTNTGGVPNRTDLTQYLVKKNKEHNTILSQTTHTCDQDCQHHRYSAYTGGMFYLSEKDQVYVNVSGGDIYEGDTSSFLGLVIIRP